MTKMKLDAPKSVSMSLIGLLVTARLDTFEIFKTNSHDVSNNTIFLEMLLHLSHFLCVSLTLSRSPSFSPLIRSLFCFTIVSLFNFFLSLLVLLCPVYLYATFFSFIYWNVAFVLFLLCGSTSSCVSVVNVVHSRTPEFTLFFYWYHHYFLLLLFVQ